MVLSRKEHYIFNNLLLFCGSDPVKGINICKYSKCNILGYYYSINLKSFKSLKIYIFT